MQNKQKEIPASEERSSSEILRSLIAQLVKVTFFALAALIVVLVGTRAWFAANNRVEAEGAQIQVRNSPIRLATTGERQEPEETYLKGANGEMLEDGTEFLYSMDGQTGTYHYTENGTIALRLNEQKTVSPGATGEVTFYIIPSQNGELSTTVYLQLAGYQVVSGAAKEVPDNPILKTLLNGHILLFRECVDGVYSNWLGSDTEKSIPIVVENADVETPIGITLYWVWPLRYQNMEKLVNVEQNPGDRIYSEWMERQKGQNSLNPINNIDFCYNDIFLAEKDSELSDPIVQDNAYNLADEFIGTNAEYLYLSIRTAP